MNALISLDKYRADSNAEIDWFLQDGEFNVSWGEAWSPRTFKWADTILFGRLSYKWMAESFPPG